MTAREAKKAAGKPKNRSGKLKSRPDGEKRGWDEKNGPAYFVLVRCLASSH